MTTTVVNNSLFRSLFKKQKLTGNNFLEWYRNLRIVLSIEDKLPFLEQPIPALPVPPQGRANPPTSSVGQGSKGNYWAYAYDHGPRDPKDF
ncbi:hypothetical protein Tco_1560238, partial [Tanacetum coccineum]